MFFHSMQDKENDCGLAVIQTVLHQNGLRNIHFEAIKKFITSEINQGLSLQDIVDVFEHFSLMTNAYKVNDQKDLSQVTFPFIATVSNNGLPHYVVVHTIKDEMITISNPAKADIEEMELDLFLQSFMGYVVLIEESKNIKVPQTIVKNDFLEKFYKESVDKVPFNLKFKIIMYSMFKLIIPILIIIGFQYLMVFQIEMITATNLIMLIGLSFILLSVYYYINIDNLKIKNDIEKDMQEKMVSSHYKNMLNSYEDQVNKNRIIGSFWNILLAIPGIVQKFYFKVNFVITFLLFTLIGFINIYLSIFSLIMLAIFSIVIYLNIKKVYNYQKGFVMEVNHFGSTVMQTINSMLDIKIFHKQNDSITYIENSVNEYSDSKMRLKEAENKVSVLHDMFIYVIIILGFVFYMISFIMSLSVSVPSLFLGLFLLFILTSDSKNTFNMFLDYQKSKVAIEYLQSEINFANKVENKSPNLKAIDQKINTIKLKNITKKFGDNQVLSNFNMEVNAGEILGLKGNNGSGKTTLLKILSGLTTPEAGEIVLNHEIDFSTLEGTTILKHAMLYTPEYYIYNNTVENNYNFSIFTKKNRECMDLYRELNFPLEIEDGFVVEADGENISFGQKNKILLLRSLKIERDIYLLDEPTTGLDYKTTMNLIDNLHVLAKDENKIVIVVTHDELLLEHCDQVLNFEPMIYT
ncbi:hypothetical protein CEW92_11665 [Bacillaceae bacterium SAS-127]|nr:hypothetical protein CEW92_11665 [Bacillaceae bacterium SAS-127]